MPCPSGHPGFSSRKPGNHRGGPDVFPRLSRRHNRATLAMGGRIPARPLRASFLLQLLVSFAVASDCPLVDARQLPPAFRRECLLADAVSLHVDCGARYDLLIAARLSAGLLPLVFCGQEKGALIPTGDHSLVG